MGYLPQILYTWSLPVIATATALQILPLQLLYYSQLLKRRLAYVVSAVIAFASASAMGITGRDQV